MVKQVEINDQTLFQCEACGFYYKERAIAQKCQDFCEKYQSCSMEFTKLAVQVDQEGEKLDQS